jgi:two-component system chemotaxis sensor kinase CheA
LKLPLTLAIIDGLLTEIGDAYYVLPLSAVEECVELTREDMEKVQGRHIANVRGEVVPYIPLRKLFSVEQEPPAVEKIVIAEVNGKRIGFVVDQVMGQHQTVIKTLGRVYRDFKEFSGATILADGTVALILDIHKLAQGVEAERATLH